MLAIVVGVMIPQDLAGHAATRMLIAWNAGAVVYLALASHMIIASTPETIRRRARSQAESRLITIALVVAAVVAAMAAVFAQLTMVKGMQGSLKTAHIALATLTLLSSWAFTHLMFALHYAHDYYEAASRGQAPGLSFPDTPDPEYGDFLYCAFIIGTSGQTADVSFTSKPMRRIGLVHSVLAFLFNTTVLAMTINIAASFF